MNYRTVYTVNGS